jgi:hypothetical protein
MVASGMVTIALRVSSPNRASIIGNRRLQPLEKGTHETFAHSMKADGKRLSYGSASWLIETDWSPNSNLSWKARNSGATKQEHGPKI